MVGQAERKGETLMRCLLDFGELLLNCGAEVSRVEDSLCRIANAYGAEEVDAFVIPSLISISLVFSEEPALTQTRRIRSDTSTDFYRLEKLNALSRGCCADPPALETLRAKIDHIAAGEKPAGVIFAGSALAAGSFAVFFGGSVWDGLTAALFALLICLLQTRVGRTKLNPAAGNLFLSLITGLAVGGLTLLLPALHADKILIGDIMLLIPGLAMTNAVRNLLIGDTISGAVRLAESLVWAGALAGGFMIAMLSLRLIGGAL